MLCGITSLKKVPFLLTVLNKLVPRKSSCPKELPTLKPLYGGHLRDTKIVSVTERCLLNGGSSQINSLCFKNLLSKVLKYSGIDPKVCQ